MCARTNERKSEKARKEYSCIPRKRGREKHVYIYDEFRFSDMRTHVCDKIILAPCYESEQYLGLVIVCVRQRERAREKETDMLLSDYFCCYEVLRH
jgi:hypothetical protein